MLEQKTIYGVCDVTFFWSYHETQAGSPYCIIEKIEVGHCNMVEIPITDDDKAYWAKQGVAACGFDCYWSESEAEAYDRISLECYTECPDCGVVGCIDEHSEVA